MLRPRPLHRPRPRFRPQTAAAILALLAIAASASSPAPAFAFEGARAKALVEEIAADEFGGRKSGFDSGRRIEEYVAERFAAWGLTPGGENGGWFHGFGMLATKERGASITLLDGPFGEVAYLYGDDFTLITNSGTGEVTAEVVLVGHGLSSPERGWDDYGDVDVTGKIALILRGTPDNGYDWTEAGARDSTFAEATRRGAAAVLYSRAGSAVQGAAIHEGAYFPEVPMAVAGKRLLDHLLLETGWNLERYQEELKKEPQPFPTGKRLRLRADVREERDARARNVVGLVPGADPARRDEIVIIGGHMDHVGRNGEGLVYNGANDNGSGTAVVMELARSFAESPTPPARTIAFVTFAAEEQGLLGSKAFVEDPCLDLDRAVAMFNFDMTGHGNGEVGIGGGEFWPEVWASFTASLDSSRADSLKTGRAWGGESSDHAPFRDAGIPAGNVWSEGDHRFYHTLEDDPRWVETFVLDSVGRMAEGWIRTLADRPGPLLVAHRDGRSLLYSSDQIDFDGTGSVAPSWVRGAVRWYEAVDFAADDYLGTLADLHARAKTEEVAILTSPAKLHAETADGRRAVLLGLRGGKVREARRPLLGTLETGLAEWSTEPATAADSTALDALVDAGLVLLVPPTSGVLAGLPEDAKRCIRFFPGRGEAVSAPDTLPQKDTLFVLSIEGPIDPAVLVGTIDSLGWHRTHLDLVPWLDAAPGEAGEAAMSAWLEELQAASGQARPRLAGLLGGNLGRL